MERQCEFGGPDDFKELSRNLTYYQSTGGKQENIKRILLEKHPDKNSNASTEDVCLVTVLTGYLNWLKSKEDSDDSLQHCFELIQQNTQPKGLLNMLIDPIFTSPTMTAEFLEMQAKYIFQANFPNIDLDSCIKDSKIEGDFSVPSFSEFKKRTAQDGLHITSEEEAYGLFLSIALRSNLEALETVHFLLNFSLLLRAFENEKQKGGSRNRTRRSRRQRKTRQQGGVVENEYTFFTWLDNIKVLPVAVSVIAIGVAYSDIVDPYLDKLNKHTYSQVLVAVGMIYSIVKSKSSYFKLEKRSYFSDEKFSKREDPDTRLTDYISTPNRPWWRSIFMGPGGETILTASVIHEKLRLLNGRIIHADHGGTELVNKFAILLEGKLSLYYRSRMSEALEQAVIVDRTNLRVEKMGNRIQIDPLSENSAEQMVEKANAQIEVTEQEMATIRSRNLAHFTDLCVASINSKIAHEIEMGEKGIENFRPLSKTGIAEVRTADTNKDISTYVLYAIGSSILRESVTGNTLRKDIITLSDFHNVISILCSSLATYALRRYGAPSVVNLACVLVTLTLFVTTICRFEDTPLAQYFGKIDNVTNSTQGTNYTEPTNSTQGTNYTEPTNSTQGTNCTEPTNSTQGTNSTVPTQRKISLSELIATKQQDDLKFFGEISDKIKKIEEEQLNPKKDSSSWMPKMVPSFGIGIDNNSLSKVYYSLYYFFSSLYRMPIILSARKMYETSKETFHYMGDKTAMVGLTIAASAMYNSYAIHSNAIEIVRQKLRDDMKEYTFSLDKFDKSLRDEAGGLPPDIADYMRQKGITAEFLNMERQSIMNNLKGNLAIIATQAQVMSALAAKEQNVVAIRAANIQADAYLQGRLGPALVADAPRPGVNLEAEARDRRRRDEERILDENRRRDEERILDENLRGGARSEDNSGNVIALLARRSALNPVGGVCEAIAAAHKDENEFMAALEDNDVKLVEPERLGGSKLTKSKRKKIKTKSKMTKRARFGGTILPFAERVKMLFTEACRPLNVFLVMELVGNKENGLVDLGDQSHLLKELKCYSQQNC